MSLVVCEHPLLHLVAFETELAAPLGSSAAPSWLTELLSDDASAPSSGAK